VCSCFGVVTPFIIEASLLLQMKQKLIDMKNGIPSADGERAMRV
jgi:hypothetical protein